MESTKEHKIWFNGQFSSWDDAKIHVLSHVIHYGSSIFEGMRCYDTKKGPACFRLKEHVSRLFDSAKIYRMPIPYSSDDITSAILETIRVNGLQGCYVRPIVFRGYGGYGKLSVNPADCPVEVVIAVWEWGQYLGAEALEKGVSVCTSSWNRMAPNTLPSLAKAGGNYMNAQLIKMEALSRGCSEAIALDTQGYVSEGSGENIFIIKNGSIYTPSTGHSILPGITRHSAITIARDLGFRVEQRSIPRESLYIADEVFFTGSAAEITPISTIDNIPVGNGVRGEITKKVQDAFFAILSGEAEDRYGWLTPV